MSIPAVSFPYQDDPSEPEVSDRDFPYDLNSMDESQIIKLRPCFGSDERYFCKRKCQWAHQCKKLRAEWLR